MHVLNEAKKRLEPTDTKCQFCNRFESTNMEENYFVPVFKEQDRTTLIVYNSVKFQRIEIGIPRCRNCKNIHTVSRGNAILYSWGAAIIIVTLGFTIWGVWGIFGIFISLLTGALGSIFLQDILIKKKGILTQKEGAMKNTTVKDFVISGWSLNQPTA